MPQKSVTKTACKERHHDHMTFYHMINFCSLHSYELAHRVRETQADYNRYTSRDVLATPKMSQSSTSELVQVKKANDHMIYDVDLRTAGLFCTEIYVIDHMIYILINGQLCDE